MIFRRTSIGSNTARIAETTNKDAEMNTGLQTSNVRSATAYTYYSTKYAYTLALILDDPSLLVVTILMIGAMRPITRLNAEARASPVPRCGVGNASGVYAYNTPYIAFLQSSQYVRVRNLPESQHEYSLCQATSAREPEVRSLSRSGGEQEQEQARRKRADRERELPSSNGVTALASSCPIDDQARQSRSGDTKDGDDSVVSVSTIDGVGEGKLVLEVEYEEAVEEGVCETDQAPDEDE